MSLIPYSPVEGREIVLRHRNALVVRDPDSRRLEIRGLTECPTCHQPLRHPSPSEPQFDVPDPHASYIDPDYFRMLRHAHPVFSDRPSSPTRRIAQATLPLGGGGYLGSRGEENSARGRGSGGGPSTGERYYDEPEDEAGPSTSEHHGIKREAFSPNYFRTFFVEERELGRGGKGVVLLVRHEIDGCALGHFACKRVPVGDDHEWLEKVLVEVELLAKLSHPNLVSYRHVWLEDAKISNFGPSVACAFILQQYCNSGDLLHYVTGDGPKKPTNEQLKARMRRRSRGQSDRKGLDDMFAPQRNLSYPEIFSLFQDITSGLAYLHKTNYIHRDLKPSNCLLHKEEDSLICLISDFGEVQVGTADRTSTGATGTISYCAPEVLQMDMSGRYGNFTPKSDIFSLGMILYFMCFGRLPYHSANAVQEELEDIDELRQEISAWKGFQDERRERPDLPPKLYQLLKKLLAVSPAERPSANEVLAAMKSESHLDGISGISRVARSSSPSLGISGRRIQNLDSPAPPSTPIPDPTKTPQQQQHQNPFRGSTRTSVSHQAVGDESPEGGQSGGNDSAVATPTTSMGSSASPQPTPRNTLRTLPSLPATPRLRAQGMAVTRSHDGLARPSSHRRDLSASPTRQRPLRSPRSPHATTPLLMPPPTSLAEDVQHWAMVHTIRTRHFLIRHDTTIVFFCRAAFFCIKMATMSRPCYPYIPNASFGLLLLFPAAIDLGMPYPRRSFPDGGSGRNGTWRALASSWAKPMRWSLFLLALHFVVLWLASYVKLLCPSDHSDWVEMG